MNIFDHVLERSREDIMTPRQRKQYCEEGSAFILSKPTENPDEFSVYFFGRNEEIKHNTISEIQLEFFDPERKEKLDERDRQKAKEYYDRQWKKMEKWKNEKNPVLPK